MIPRKVLLLSLAALWLTGPAILAQEHTHSALLEVAPLDDALWQGVLTLRLEGPLHGQHLENRHNDAGVPVGFIKEKSRMRFSYFMEIRFMVNPLGEYTMAGRSLVDGETDLSKEYWYQFEEEHQVEETSVKTRRMVRVSERSNYTYRYEGENTFDQDNFAFGTLRMQPSGRMDRRGKLRIVGTLDPVLTAEGKEIMTKERQPATEEWGVKESVTEIKRELPIQIEFTVELELRKKPVTGPVQITFDMSNPLIFPGADRGPSVYRNEVKATGNLSLTPLFGKGR
jgi:hypothetical protein